MNLPSELVDRLAPQHNFADWLYISSATLLGALVALVAAYIAWRAIRGQIKSDTDNVNAELQLQEKHRIRAERLSVLSEAVTFVSETYVRAGKVGADADQARQLMPLQMSAVVSKLKLLGMEEQRKAVGDFCTAANALPVGSSTNDLFQMFVATNRTLNAGLESDGSGAGT